CGGMDTWSAPPPARAAYRRGIRHPPRRPRTVPVAPEKPRRRGRGTPGGSRPRPGPAQGRTRPRGGRWMTRSRPRGLRWSYALPHSRGQEAQLLAIFRNGTPRDADSLTLEDFHDGLVCQGLLRIFVFHQLLDCRADAARRHVLTIHRTEAAGKEEFQREHTTRCLRVLLIGHTAYSALVHADRVGHLAQGERFEVLNAFVEEVALPVDN